MIMVIFVLSCGETELNNQFGKVPRPCSNVRVSNVIEGVSRAIRDTRAVLIQRRQRTRSRIVT